MSAIRIRKYTRLTRGGMSRGSFFTLMGVRVSVWMGSDHLLFLLRSLCSEDYKRFYYRDIQGISVYRNNHMRNTNIAFGVATFFLMALALVSNELMTICLSLAAVCIVVITSNSLLGPAYTTCVYTAVNKEELPGRRRFRSTMRMVDTLKGLVTGVQGSVPAGEAGPGLESLSRAGRPPVHAAEVKDYNGLFHGILFCALTVNGILAGTGFIWEHVLTSMLGMLTGIACSIFMIGSLIRQHRSAMKGGIRIATWVTAAYVVYEWVAGSVLYMMVIFEHPESANNQWALFMTVARISPYDSPYFAAMSAFTVIFCIPVGVIGLMLLNTYRAERSRRLSVARPAATVPSRPDETSVPRTPSSTPPSAPGGSSD